MLKCRDVPAEAEALLDGADLVAHGHADLGVGNLDGDDHIGIVDQLLQFADRLARNDDARHAGGAGSRPITERITADRTVTGIAADASGRSNRCHATSRAA